MFYSSDLLIFKRGKFSLIWLAATRGEKFLSKRDLNMVDVYFACSEIMEYISQNQHIKLSLYLSSQLTFGLCVIYQKKIDKLLIDLQDLYKKSLTTFTFNQNTCDKNKGTRKSKDKENFNITNISGDFYDLNSSFGMLNKLEKNLSFKETEMDLDNQVAYLNQARFEDITLVDCELGSNNLRNQLENDLEPVNVELLQELLGAADPLKDGLEHYLEIITDATQKLDPQIRTNDQNNYCHEVDLDRVEIADKTDNIVEPSNQMLNVSLDINDQILIDQNNEILDENAANFSRKNIFEILNSIPISENQLPGSCDITENNTVKSSRPIDEIEVDINKNKKPEIINLVYHIHGRKNKKRISPQVRKRKQPPAQSLIIDQVTTISHQVLRENMIKKCGSVVDKESLFPNEYVVKSLKGQIASSTANLFDFPGSYTTLHCPKHLRFWLNCKEKLKSYNRPIFENCLSISKNPKNHQEIVNISMDEAVSIERVRGTSSFNMNIPVDSFTLDSENMQRSIQQSSFDAEKTVLENNELNVENVDDHVNFSTEKSMMPIIEEDVNQRPEINEIVTQDQEDVETKYKLTGKDDVWKIINSLFNKELNNYKPWDEIRIAFSDICPIGFSRKVASMVFLTLLRLGKYNKIKIYQQNSLSEIFIGLPSKEL